MPTRTKPKKLIHRVSQDDTPQSRDAAYAREVIEIEARSIRDLSKHIDQQFCDALDVVDACAGRVVLAGMGKSGFIAQKLSATLASTGCPSLYLHPAEALHGDLGRMATGDVVILLSNSGETEEVVRMMGPLKRLGIKVIVMTGQRESTLARAADILLYIGDIEEACPIGLVPTASTTAMLVLGDALAMALFRRRGLGRADFARFHPAGALGRKLMRVHEVMRSGDANPLVSDTATLVEVLRVMTQTRGRPGAASIVNKSGKLVGVFTDGDLRRLLETNAFNGEERVRLVMTKQPMTVRDTALVEEAERVLREHRIDNVPVVDQNGVPVGLIDVQDLLAHNAYSVK